MVTDNCNLTWIDGAGGDIPPGAIKGGHNEGDDLYIGRAEIDGSVVLGKVVYLLHITFNQYNLIVIVGSSRT